jgi:hypothetical protein
VQKADGNQETLFDRFALPLPGLLAEEFSLTNVVMHEFQSAQSGFKYTLKYEW